MADVGGNTDILSRLLPDDKIHILNKTDQGLPNQVIGDIRRIDLSDNHFDFVVSLDTLEHIKNEDRFCAIKEMLRISRDFVILGLPFKDSSIIINEYVAVRFYKSLMKKDHIYLKDHIENLLPDASLISSFLRKSKVSYKVIKNTELNIWLMLTVIGFYAENQYKNYPLYKELCRYFNQHLYELGNEPPYRKIFVISKKNKIRLNQPYKKVDINKRVELYYNILKALEQVNQPSRVSFLSKIKHILQGVKPK